MRNISDWLDSTHQRPDGTTARIPTRWAVLAPQAETSLSQNARELAGSGGSVVLVYDPQTEYLVERVERQLVEQGLTLHHHKVPNKSDGSSPSADDHATEALHKQLQKLDAKLAVSIGSGTLNDIAKYGAFLSDLPYLSYATASSMNGYTSGIAALYVKGLKSTVKCAPPLGVYADPEVIAKAEPKMTLAGLGDLCSKPFAGADAAVANLIRNRPTWDLPGKMVEDIFQRALDNAEKIGAADPQAIADLMEALWISGFSMSLAGSSSPASGGEHLWSHRIDMEQHDAHLPPQALHGTQVGVACGLVRPLFARVAELDASEVAAKLQQAPPEPDPAETAHLAAYLARRHPELSESSLQAVQKEATKKYDRELRLSTRAGLAKVWTEAQAILRIASQYADRVALALERSGSPMTPQDIGVDQERSDRILYVCRDIRNRSTILDLASDLLEGSERFYS